MLLKIHPAFFGDERRISRHPIYQAEIGGPAVPVTGDIGGSTVAVTNEGGGLKETFYRDGKVVNETLSTVSADGKTMTWVSSDPRDGSKVTGTAAKTN